ncbi:hypothetical protein QEN19_003557 [Hanseniaspora menglaensis]
MSLETKNLSNGSTVSGFDAYGKEIRYSILFNLPIEIWLCILTKDLNEVDLRHFFNSISLAKFKSLLDSETESQNLEYNELWKLIFKNAYKSLEFPNISKTEKDFKLELNTKIKISNSWKHSKGIIHKYNLSYNNFRQHMNTFRGFQEQDNNFLSVYSVSDNLLFNYPKVISYNEGNITLLNVETAGSSNSASTRSVSNLKKSTRFTYIPCISPSNCSFYKVYKNQIVFGNKEGSLYIKQFEKKAYLNPVTEIFDLLEDIKTPAHSYGISCVEIVDKTCGYTQKAYKSSTYSTNFSQHVVSVDVLGNMKIWFINNKNTNEGYKKVFDLPNATLAKTTHIFINDSIHNIILLDEASNLHVIELGERNDGTLNLELVNKFEVRVPFSKSYDHDRNTQNTINLVKYDYGGNSLLITSSMELIIIKVTKLYERLLENDLVNDYFLSYKFSNDESIQDIAIDEETSKEKQNRELLGKDGCLITIVTELKDNSKYTNAYVFNIRTEESLTAQLVLKFFERCYATAVNKLLLTVYLKGRLILYNALNGEELKIIKIATSPQSKKNPANDYNMIKISMDKIILYGIYNNDLQFLNYNIDSIKRFIEKGSLKNLSTKDRVKKEHLESLHTTSHGKKKGGYVKSSNQEHTDPQIVYEYYQNKNQDIVEKEKFEKFDIDLHGIDGLNLDEFDGDDDSELTEFKIALSESLLETRNENKTDLFGNIVKPTSNGSFDDMTEEEQLAFALSLSMDDM